jgi:Family of unknown function (DUF5752)
MALIPFVFHGCLAVRELVGPAAGDARALLEGLGQASDETLFTHTAGTMLRRPVQADAYPNDFALWAATELGDGALAERLAMVDVFDAGSLDALRANLVAVLEDHLHRGPAAAAPAVEPFVFLRTHVVPVPLGVAATTLREFRDGLAVVDASALFYHVVEVRYRLGRDRGDFAEWAEHGLERPDLAARLARIDAHVGSLERLRDRCLTVLDDALVTGS